VRGTGKRNETERAGALSGTAEITHACPKIAVKAGHQPRRCDRRSSSSEGAAGRGSRETVAVGGGNKVQLQGQGQWQG